MAASRCQICVCNLDMLVSWLIFLWGKPPAQFHPGHLQVDRVNNGLNALRCVKIGTFIIPVLASGFLSMGLVFWLILSWKHGSRTVCYHNGLKVRVHFLCAHILDHDDASLRLS